jgi:glycosyltransferase involved in cell wall biosynthesis
MRCDIIIPTYNSAAVLPQALEALFGQEIPAGWECRLLLTDDGSKDETVIVAERLCQANGWEYAIIRNKHRGRAHNRNQALNQVRANIIYFLQADILLRPGALAAHLRFHDEHPSRKAAALGYISWDPRLNPSPLMEWMMHGGPQNDFDALLGQHRVKTPRYFYGANISLKREFLAIHRFSEEFSEYGWEDYDLGLRLTKKGLELYFLENARALHSHYYDLGEVELRQRLVGLNSHLIAKNPPGRWKYQLLILSGGSWLLHRIVAIWPHYSWPWLYKLLTMAWFWEGYAKGLNRAK